MTKGEFKQLTQYFQPSGEVTEYRQVAETAQSMAVVSFPTVDEAIEAYSHVGTMEPQPAIRKMTFQLLPDPDVRSYAKSISYPAHSHLLGDQNIDSWADDKAYAATMALFKPAKQKPDDEGHEFVGYRGIIINRLPRDLTDADINLLATMFSPCGKLLHVWYHYATKRPQARI